MAQPHLTRQLDVIHVSDVHFGQEHQFNPPTTAAGDPSSPAGMQGLIDKLLEDLRIRAQRAADDDVAPVVVCITGDLVETGRASEFAEARALIDGMRAHLRNDVGSRGEVVYIVPGNHDVLFNEQETSRRWHEWAAFYNAGYNTAIRDDNPWSFARLHDRVDDLGALILCLNSSVHVVEGSADEQRGQIDERQLGLIEDCLAAIPSDKLNSAIRIAMIHHHPVLIPSLVEPGRGYDAVVRSGELLSLLHKYGFHLVLHGHKHHPHVFTEDIRSAFDATRDQQMLIVAGGSVGYKKLPRHPSAMNTYNQITIKWHPEARQARIRVVTRGLVMFDPEGRPLRTAQWRWKTLRRDDRSMISDKHIPEPVDDACRVGPFDARIWSPQERTRTSEYARTRGNMPVIEIRPSLMSGQAYEARFWIVGHRRADRDVPITVTWSAGAMFPTITIRREDDERFLGSFDYWDSMLVQAFMTFADGQTACTHVYARVPK